MDVPGTKARPSGPFWRQRLAIIAAAAALLTFLAPYGSGAMQSAARAAYWALLVAAGLGVSVIASKALDHRLPRLHPAIEGALLSLVVSLPLAGGVMLLARLKGLSAPSAGIGETFLSVWVITVALTAVGLLASRAAVPQATTTAVEAAEFIQRLPPWARRAELWAVSAEDHYVRVYTDAGEALMLMRMADALRALSGLPGAQTHRSWWVAEAGLARSAARRGTRVALRNGIEAPISRSRRPAIRGLGWFA